MLYLCSDTHLWHKNVLWYDWYSEFSDINERDTFVIDELCNLTEKDEVILMGDLCRWTDKDFISDMVDRLWSVRAKMSWIVGNHDYKHFVADFGHLFTEISHYKEIKYNKKKYILCHYPIQDRNGKFKWSIHIHWHQHAPTIRWYNRTNNRYDISFTWGKLLRSINEIDEWILDKNIFKSYNFNDDAILKT